MDMLEKTLFGGSLHQKHFMNRTVVRNEKICPVSIPKDTVSFSGSKKAKKWDDMTINERIKEFQKLMGDKPIPQEVMKILKNKKFTVAPAIELEAKPAKTDSKVIDMSSSNQSTESPGFLPNLLTGILPTDILMVNNKSSSAIKSSEPDIESTESIVVKPLEGVPPADPKKKIKSLSIVLENIYIKKASESWLNHLFKPKTAEVYFISIVDDGTNSPQKVITGNFEGLKEGDNLYNHGLQIPYTLYQYNKDDNPTKTLNLLDFKFLIMEADEKSSKDIVDVLEKIKSEKEYQEFTQASQKLLESGAPSNAITTFASFGLGFIKNLLSIDRDDQMSFYALRFNKMKDALGAQREYTVDTPLIKFTFKIEAEYED